MTNINNLSSNVMKAALNYIGKGLRAYRRNFFAFLGSALIIAFVSSFILGAGLLMIALSSASFLNSEAFISGALPPEDIFLAMASPLNIALLVITLIFAFAAKSILSAGIYGVFLEGAKGRAKMGHFIDYVKSRGAHFLIIMAIILIIASVFLVVSYMFGLYAGDVFGLAFHEAVGLSDAVFSLLAILFMLPFLACAPFGVAYGKPIIASFKESTSIGKKYYPELLAFWVSVYILSLVFAQIPYAGLGIFLLLLFPAALFTLAGFYLEKSIKLPEKGEPEADNPAGGKPAPSLKKEKTLAAKTGPDGKKPAKKSDKPAKKQNKAAKAPKKQATPAKLPASKKPAKSR